MERAKQELQIGLPFSNFDSLLIDFIRKKALKRIKRGECWYDSNTMGHFITAKLEMKNSKVLIYDSLNSSLKSSEYFDFPVIANVIKYA